MANIAIVGAGLSGLSAAYALEQLGYSPFIFEADDRIGGRTKTDHYNGFILDHGFQIVLTSYHELLSVINKKELELGLFPSGAMIRHDGEWLSLLNPIKDPEKLVFGKETFFFDFLKLSKIYLKQKLQSDQRSQPNPHPPSIWELLQEAGISHSFMESAIRPFFAGVFFEQDLTTSSQAFLRLLPQFIEGKAGLPKKGIETLPKILASRLTRTQIHLNQKVTKIEKGTLYLEKMGAYSIDAVILATDTASMSTFAPPLAQRKMRSATCLYFSIDSDLIEPAPFIYLQGDPSQPINNFSFNNLLQASYAPEGQLLVNVVVVNSKWQKEVNLHTIVANQLSSYFNIESSRWQHLKTYSIEHALPDQTCPPFYHGKFCLDKTKKIFLCGEAVAPPSFNDAFISGKMAAQTLHSALNQ